MVLEIVFWILLILAFVGYFAPEPFLKYRGFLDLVLFVILGLKLFGAPH
jgi:hypothetical protein